MRLVRFFVAVAYEAFEAFVRDDGWAIASHIALSTLMSLFPFLIFITAIAGTLGTQDLADQVALLLLEVWPAEVAGPIGSEVASVLTTTHRGLLTVGVMLAIYFSSSGVESLRIGLNRAYGVIEMRRWYVLRVESIGYVLVGAMALLALSFLILLEPLFFRAAMRYAPWIEPVWRSFNFARMVIAVTVLILTLVLVHKWLPSGRRSLVDIAPGLLVTLGLWLVMGAGFGRYLADFASTYVSMYAGLASGVVALVFLYWTATIFVYGGELNAVIMQRRAKRRERKDRLAQEPVAGT